MSIEIEVKEMLKYFLNQNHADKIESKGGRIKVYNVGENLVRVDIRREKPNEKEGGINK